MTKPAIEVVGLNRLVRDLKALEPELVTRLKSVNADLAADVASSARSLVPRRSGRLESSIRSSGTNRSGIVRTGSRSVPYAGPIHFGWHRRNITPHPFLYDAMDARRAHVLTEYTRALEQLTREVST